ncbi:MAG: DNA-processing protein DprA [Syntrophales bacterium]
MEAHRIRYWLALKFIEGIGNVGLRNLIETIGSPEEIFRAPANELVKVRGIDRDAVERIRKFRDWNRVDKELEQVARSGASVVTLEDPIYPERLLKIHDCPALLYVRGVLVQDEACIAVVGSRQASTYGKYSTHKLCRELAANGLTVVSGMARGIDSAAHRGAIAGQGRTIAVLGSGMNVIYPPENEDLYNKIPESGAVITEFPFGTPPQARNFPARNRIISGISFGVIVVEATDRSGSLITARCALEQGREVFAVPGNIDSPGSRGTHKLIRQGARLVEGIQDILDEIMPQMEKEQQRAIAEKTAGRRGGMSVIRAGKALRENETAVIKHISDVPSEIDDIIAKTGFKPGDVLNILLNLELWGHVRQLPGKKFVLNNTLSLK